MAELIVYMPDHVSGDRDPADVRGEIIGNLVRCKDCKYKQKSYVADRKWWCNRLEKHCEDDWFCANGERKE